MINPHMDERRIRWISLATSESQGRSNFWIEGVGSLQTLSVPKPHIKLLAFVGFGLSCASRNQVWASNWLRFSAFSGPLAIVCCLLFFNGSGFSATIILTLLPFCCSSCKYFCHGLLLLYYCSHCNCYKEFRGNPTLSGLEFLLGSRLS